MTKVHDDKKKTRRLIGGLAVALLWIVFLLVDGYFDSLRRVTADLPSAVIEITDLRDPERRVVGRLEYNRGFVYALQKERVTPAEEDDTIEWQYQVRLGNHYQEYLVDKPDPFPEGSRVVTVLFSPSVLMIEGKYYSCQTDFAGELDLLLNLWA